MSWNQTILIVEDEKDLLESYRDFLQSVSDSDTAKKSSRGGGTTSPSAAMGGPSDTNYKFETILASSADQALDLVRAHYAAGKRIAAGFFDVKLGGQMDGLELLREIWKIDIGLHASIVTAYHDRSIDDMDQFFGAKVKDQWDYLNKPFTRAEIIQKARQMVASWNRKRELEATQAQLVQAERMAAVGQVARGVGHEFGNILQAIVGKADLGLIENDIGKIHEKLKLILSAAERAAHIIRNLQFFSKTSSSQVSVELAHLMEAPLSLVDHDLRKHSVEVVKHLDPSVKIQARASEIEQVFMNLYINAMHAMPQGGKIEISCRLDGRFAVAEVKDHGTGIPADVVGRIFDFAFTTKGEKGSGLGLSISKGIVENHLGMIEVETALGIGTTFRIRLPKA